jgi:hypothetical protein
MPEDFEELITFDFGKGRGNLGREPGLAVSKEGGHSRNGEIFFQALRDSSRQRRRIGQGNRLLGSHGMPATWQRRQLFQISLTQWALTDVALESCFLTVGQAIDEKPLEEFTRWTVACQGVPDS